MNRGSFTIKPGVVLRSRSKPGRFLIKAWDDGNTVIAEDLDTGFSSRLSMFDLMPLHKHEKEDHGDLFAIPEKKMEQAKDRFEIIEPLIKNGSPTRKQVEKRAQEKEVSIATIYRWIRAYRDGGVLTALIRSTRSDLGSSRLSPEQEELIQEAIKYYLTPERPSISECYTSLQTSCRDRGITAPHLSTFRERILKVDEQTKVTAREGRNAAYNRFEPKLGSMPGADYPYAILQIDHKQLDVTVVDEQYRMPIGFPWVTVAIDVYSRTIAGYYISLDAPSTLSAAMCISMSILSKEKILAMNNMETDWPCFGIPRAIHMDNAKEFRGNALKHGAQEYCIDIIFRKVKRPNYGAHIESLLGSAFTKSLKPIPGNRFSNPVERGSYKPDDKAIMTLRELEAWLLDLIVCTYHQRSHSALDCTPSHKYMEGLLGTNDMPGPGRVILPVSEERLLLDFLPMEKRTVQRPGVMLDFIWYYDDVLRRWIDAPDPENPNNKREFIFRRDPRDISHIWFFDPETKEYHRIPYRKLSHPAITLWEYKATRKWMKEKGLQTVDEDSIFDSFQRRNEMLEQAALKTKKARREIQKSKYHAEHRKKKSNDSGPAAILEEGIDIDALDAFDDIEIYDK